MQDKRSVRSAFDSAYVNGDVACHRCSYNLRGLPVEGSCPECGAPVRVAIAGDALHFADPRWLKTLSRGAFLAKIPLIWCGLTPVAILISEYSRGSPNLLSAYAVGVAAFLTIGVFALGMWLFTTPDPGGTTGGWKNDPAKRVRIALITLLLTYALTVVAVALPLPSNALLCILFLGAPVGVCGLLGAMATCALGSRLASRIGDAASFDGVGAYRLGYLISWGLFWIGLAVQLLFEQWDVVILCGLGGIGMLGFGALVLLVPTMLARDVKAHRAQSEHIWNAALGDKTE